MKNKLKSALWMGALISVATIAQLTVAQAASHMINPAASSLAWKGSKKTGSSHNGHIVIKNGELELNKKNQLTGGSFVVDMKKISNEDLKSDPKNQAKLIGHLSSADFFNAEKFPESTFKITQVTPKSKDEVLVKGNLTLVGKTNAVEFPAKTSFAEGIFTSDATLKINRTQWDLKYGSGNFFKELTADKIINDEIEFTVHLTTAK
jgi:polyisoprenoid-binding protein YceI